MKKLIDNNQVVIQYALKNGEPAQRKYPENPNGSTYDIAGICDPTGRIFGLMPHPEAYNHFTNHPDWVRIKEKEKRAGKISDPAHTPGIQIFKNAINYLENK